MGTVSAKRFAQLLLALLHPALIHHVLLRFVLLCFTLLRFALLRFAYEMNLTAGVALFNAMMPHKITQVVLLARREYTGSAAYRAGAIERSKKCLPYEGRAVGYSLHRFKQLSIGLECDDFIITPHVSLLRTSGITG